MSMPVAFLPFSAWMLLFPGAATTPAPTGFPYTDESLNYTVNWPTGLSLGEAHLRASKSGDRWRFEFSLDAAVPGFTFSDRYHSLANAELCSLEFDKDARHGQRLDKEKTVFDYHAGSATRTTLAEGGGHTDIGINNCAYDGLAYVFYARRELAQGRVPPQETVLFGAPYSARLVYTGAQDVTINDRRRQADRVLLYLKGPASDSTVEIFYDRDPARTPLIVKAPFAMGTFSMELVR
jgi:Protein of unknown function (DUF3108)